MGKREDRAGSAWVQRVDVAGPIARGEQPLSSQKSREMRRSFCREFVTNKAESSGRAVPSLAFAQLNRVTGAGPLCPSAPSRFAQLVRCQRLSRLCELMYSILPGLRSIQDLAGVIPEKPISCDSEYRQPTRVELVELRLALQARTLVA
jgi:hypothetical protein